jgi:signal transduction histidine kinase
MRERANQIGGDLNIWNSPVAGVEIELTIPSKIAYRP